MTPTADAACRCDACGQPQSVDAWTWRCACGGPLTWLPPIFDPAAVDDRRRSVWRYAAQLPAVGQAISLGEGGTPLVAARLGGRDLYVKAEFCQPSGAYKDRGAAVLASAVADARPRQAVEDSSGNAGASLAGYLAGTGIALRLFVPAGTPEGKVRQARLLGAEVDSTAPGRRAASALAEAAAASAGTVYASHVWSPYFLAGATTLAYELWDELGQAPAEVVLPIGHGLLLLGLDLGFGSLRRAGLIGTKPRLIAVQAAACAPLAQAWSVGEPLPLAVPEGVTVAGGVRVARPVRGRAVLAAVRSTGGRIVAVAEEDILAARDSAAAAGWYVEPTSALAVAALGRLPARDRGDGPTVVILTGSGLKAD